jgi:hypothetical protein
MADKAATTPASQDPTADREPAAPAGAQARLQWDDSQMTTSYANAVNVVSTQEEVMLFFGTNQTWNPGQSREINVRLSDRIILNPHAAKRLLTMLQGVLQEYERRFGNLHVG